MKSLIRPPLIYRIGYIAADSAFPYTRIILLAFLV